MLVYTSLHWKQFCGEVPQATTHCEANVGVVVAAGVVDWLEELTRVISAHRAEAKRTARADTRGMVPETRIQCGKLRFLLLS